MRIQLILLTGLLAIQTGCCDNEKIPVLIRKLDSSDSHDRNDSALALARCGADAERAVPRLSEMLYDKNVGVQSAAAYALRKIDTRAARSALAQAESARKR